MAGVGSAVGQGISRKIYVSRILGLVQSNGTNLGHKINLEPPIWNLVPLKAIVTNSAIFCNIVSCFLCSKDRYRLSNVSR